MANHKQAIKRNKQNQKTRAHNRTLRSALRSTIKNVRAETDSSKAETNLKIAVRALDKAVSKGIIHKKTASRKVSRLSHFVSKLS